MELITVKQATENVGGLSNTSKLPCKSFGISAYKCKVGSELRKINGSICSKCYALKGQYVIGPVPNAHAARHAVLYRKDWCDNMVISINNAPWFRWFDSGDVQSLRMLRNIVIVAERTPDTKHWLPTKEAAIVAAYLKKYGAFPDNLIVRVSAPMIDGPAPKRFEFTSTAHQDKAPIGFECTAPQTKNKCEDCRACWDRSVKNVSYKMH